MLWVKRIISAGLLILLLAQVTSFLVPYEGAYPLAMLAVTLLALGWYAVSAPLGVRLMKAQPLVDPALREQVDGYARIMGLARPPQLYVVDQPLANAYAFGRPGRSAVVLTTRLLDGLHPLQLVAVLGHELHHIRARDTLFTVFATTIQIVLQIASWVGVLVAAILGAGLAMLNAVVGAFGANARGTHLSVVELARGVGAAIQRLGSLFANFMSREAELLADRAGAYLATAVTGEPASMGARYMASALEAIEQMNGQVPASGLMAVLMSTHPSLQRRLRNLEQL